METKVQSSTLCVAVIFLFCNTSQTKSGVGLKTLQVLLDQTNSKTARSSLGDNSYLQSCHLQHLSIAVESLLFLAPDVRLRRLHLIFSKEVPRVLKTL